VDGLKRSCAQIGECPNCILGRIQGSPAGGSIDVLPGASVHTMMEPACTCPDLSIAYDREQTSLARSER